MSRLREMVVSIVSEMDSARRDSVKGEVIFENSYYSYTVRKMKKKVMVCVDPTGRKHESHEYKSGFGYTDVCGNCGKDKPKDV